MHAYKRRKGCELSTRLHTLERHVVTPSTTRKNHRHFQTLFVLDTSRLAEDGEFGVPVIEFCKVTYSLTLTVTLSLTLTLILTVTLLLHAPSACDLIRRCLRRRCAHRAWHRSHEGASCCIHRRFPRRRRQHRQRRRRQ